MPYGAKAIKQSNLEVWDNPCPDRDYVIDISYPEFTCLCPRSGYPDFAEIRISYVPNRKIVELRALKLWLNSFLDRAISHEAVTNLIFDELKKALKPRRMEVVGDFNVRGNVKTVVRVALCRRSATCLTNCHCPYNQTAAAVSYLRGRRGREIA